MMMTALLKLESPWNNPPSADDETQTSLAPAFLEGLVQPRERGVRPRLPGTGSMARITLTSV